ncbi:hypothetical protein TPHA_0A03060 [Tetrapisispora phaffii CBS 4417]|uniref:BPL/LPL catalytic domain-containing protein n=1 Tax=Tetrapisispora phaffii (strain ATCC 24235 / CBS 4417 / NBRC 1672 / NRRL Y-8282 / UCD 70-5) TaxID=1071381 RepID=G8BNA6_TETPH|nr:hypothetical protein TPHA_0A03060 [Tetrapisispora phaffii CBS 4417]CCE61384.1 hypothetical protein TPHA_0A03060 [Tetrapisispora phaffii CBS 4417]
MNVLVYNGNGTSLSSVKHTVDTLRAFLEPYYSVSTISAKGLQTEPWISKTSAVVFPGGADLPYVRDCKAVVPKIKKFVQNGGIYIGFCAGGYFGSSRVEFAQGDPSMEVIGNRDLAFFKGITRGPAFAGYQYNSEVGARAVELALTDGSKFRTYFNGGSVFIDAKKYDNVEILAKYTEPVDTATLNSEADLQDAAVVVCNVGNGKALLTGPHPEFIPELLKHSEDKYFIENIIPALLANEKQRLHFMENILKAAGLKCNKLDPDRKPLYLTPIIVTTSSGKEDLIEELSCNLIKNVNTIENISENHTKLNLGTDTSDIFKGVRLNYKSALMSCDNLTAEENRKVFIFADKTESSIDKSLTPYFDIEKYFKELKTETIGNLLLYANVVSSTSTMLNNNKCLLASFPRNSVVHVGSIQTAGIGRGGNHWVNPIGLSASTVVVTFPITPPDSNKSIVFVQYLAMLAYCQAITSYGPGFEDVPIRIKWPNDLYVLSPEYYSNKGLNLVNRGIVKDLAPLSEIEPAYIKVGGMLVNTNIINKEYNLLIGCGINVNNSHPSTSLNRWVSILNEERKVKGLALLPKFDIEKLLALYLGRLERLLNKYTMYGSNVILPGYYKYWLHNNQVVTLTGYNSVRAVITGITDDYGLLLAKECRLGSDTDFTGTTYQLQPDGNTFDIFKGLISTKIFK